MSQFAPGGQAAGPWPAPHVLPDPFEFDRKAASGAGPEVRGIIGW